MRRLSARTSGTIIAVAGLVLAAVHLQSAVSLRASPGVVLIEAVVPLVLALAVAGVGVLLRGGRLAPPASAERVLGWAVVGTVSLSVAVGWLFVDAGVRGWRMPVPMRTALNAATLGSLVGLVIGIYDARARRQRERAAQLTRINDTLRIATERDELETVVCRRLTDSDIYDGAWIGRYAPGDEFVRPSAWAGHDDEYFAPLEITIELGESNGGGPGSEAIGTGEIQPVQDVFAEPSLEPWRELLAEKGVESIAVVPLVGVERVHGLLSVYANRANVFGSQERERRLARPAQPATGVGGQPRTRAYDRRGRAAGSGRGRPRTDARTDRGPARDGPLRADGRRGPPRRPPLGRRAGVGDGRHRGRTAAHRRRSGDRPGRRKPAHAGVREPVSE
jgi:hypothetical protein